jgi:hypothetical protein
VSGPLVLFLASMVAYATGHWVIGTVVLVVTVFAVAA